MITFRTIHRSFLVIGILALLAGTPAAAAVVTPAQRCAAKKLDATARTLVAALGCHARAAQAGSVVNAACVARANAMLATAFARIEDRGGCVFVDDVAAVDAMVDTVIAELTAALSHGPPLGRCAAVKLRAAGRRAFRDFACQRRAVRMASAVDPACTEEAAAGLVKAFASAEKRSTCGATGDAPAVETMVESFTGAASARLLTGSPSGSNPSALSATIVGDEIQLGWVAPPAASGNTHVRLLRRLNTAPVDANDPSASVIFFGTATAASDDLTALLPSTATTPRTYHYAAFGCTAGGVCETTGSRTTSTPTLVQALRAGGYVLHWRHSAATVCADQTSLGTAATTMSPNWWKSCDAQCPPGGMATARQLDANGVTEADAIGTSLDTLGITIGRVVSSEFCRNFQTAELMDFGPSIELRPEITFFVHDEANRCTNSYALIAETPAAGTNTALIGHAGFSCPVLEGLAWSEAAIFKPDGVGGSTLVARVLWNGWAALP
jgi:phosphohistidine phosphatase SixA